MLEALFSLDSLHDFSNSLFSGAPVETLVAWVGGLFCADLHQMHLIGEEFTRSGQTGFLQVVATQDQCVAVRDIYHLDVKYLGDVYTYHGTRIQIMGGVPHGTNGPMVYYFQKLNTLAA